VQPTLDDVGDESRPDGMTAVAAAHVVLSGRRQATRIDLLLSTLIEILVTGSATTEALVEAVQAAWPAAAITEADVVEALEIGCTQGSAVFMRAEGFDGMLWALGDAGRIEADSSREWVDDVRRRAVADVQERSRDDFRSCGDAEAAVWVDRLTVGLSAGIAAAEESFLGAIEIGNGTVRPRGFDRAAVLAVVTNGAASDVSEFLAAAAMAAIDPSDPFGNELVTMLATTCVLHGHLARLDLAEQQRRLGPMRGQEAVLDTPLLLSLVSDAEAREPLDKMITAAVAAGANMIAPQHYLDELQDLLESRRQMALAEEAMLADPYERAAYIALAEGDDVVVAYARTRAAGAVRNWAQFEDQVKDLPRRLREAGVEIRPHGNVDSEQVDRCREALQAALAQKGRGLQAIERDAHTLSMALRHRRHFRRENRGAVWPGLFVITYDRRLTPAYQQLDPDSVGIPLALTPSMFTLLLARIRPVPEVAELTEAASRMLTREVAERVAVRYPPTMAAELARNLGAAGGATDVRVAQFDSVSGVIENADATDITQEVLRRRLMRLREVGKHSGLIGEAERTQAAGRIAATERQKAEIEGRKQELQDHLDRERTDKEQLQAQLDDHWSSDEVQRMRRRATARGVAVTLNVVVLVWLVSRGRPVPAALLVAGGILLWWQTTPWVNNPRMQLRPAAPGIAADTLALLAAFGDWFRAS
jgi:hypothetical protein